MEKSGSVSTKRKTCMKHKKKDKKKVFEKKNADVKPAKPSAMQKERVKSVIDPAQFSSNWQKLLSESKELKEEREKARKRKRHDMKGELSSVANKKAKTSENPEIWFDDVDEFLIEGTRDEPEDLGQTIQTTNKNEEDHNPLVKSKSFTGVTRAIAIDCEMVGVGPRGQESILGRVSVVNQFGQCIYDTFVRPTEPVTDYRTEVSGVRPEDMANGEEFAVVQKKVADLMKGRVLVGHAIENDLKVLFLDHPRKMIRDTQRYKSFRTACGGGKPALRKLTAKLLKVPIQTGEHSSIQDAQATMRLYTMYRKQWEKDLRKLGAPSQKHKKKKSEKSRMLKEEAKKRRQEEHLRNVTEQREQRSVLKKCGGHLMK